MTRKRPARHRAARVVQEIFGLGQDSPHARVRYFFWVTVTLVSFAFTGRAITPLRKMAEELFRMDNAIRAAALSTFRAEDLVPITLVEIDDASAAHWGMVDITPRRELARLIAAISDAGPAAVVVDIDLSDLTSDTPATAASEQEFRQFLKSYRGTAPLILVRRVTSGADGSLRASRSALVDALQAEPNPLVSWAHALYVTDGDGIVRRWQETVHACVDAEHVEPLTAVPISVLSQARWSEQTFQRPAYAPGAAQSCLSLDKAQASHIVMFGDRLTGAEARVSGPSVMRLSAWQLTDSRVEREDRLLFHGRVVIVGGSHERANDSWRTPVGIMPGVELIANTVRFGSGQLKYHAQPPRIAGMTVEGLCTVWLFLWFVGLAFGLRASIAALFGLLVSALTIQFAVSVFGFFPAINATETALLLFVQFKVFEGVFSFVHEARKKGRRVFLSERFSEDPRELHTHQKH